MSTQQKKRFIDPMQEKVFPHKHCSVCTKMVPEYSDGYCSARCRVFEKPKDTKNTRRWLWWIIGGAAIAIVFVILIVSVK
jgi:predicted nucleic acid-binding Zn ribbon protein